MSKITSSHNHKNKIILIHFKKRVKERCGVEISTAKVNWLCGQVKRNTFPVVEKQSLARRKVLVPLKLIIPDYQGEEQLIVVFDKRRERLVTVMKVEDKKIK